MSNRALGARAAFENRALGARAAFENRAQTGLFWAGLNRDGLSYFQMLIESLEMVHKHSPSAGMTKSTGAEWRCSNSRTRVRGCIKQVNHSGVRN
jgi:hypothetical protein